MPDGVIVLEGVRKEYGDVVAVEAVDLSIERGEFFSLLGPSGCGKTTLLRLVAGFETPTAGRVLLAGEDVSDVPPHRRNVNTVFQQYALFPHLSVLDNVAFGLRAKRVTESEATRRAREMLDLVRLGDHGRRRPHQLSGGQQQRVALARALVNLPSALLLDEPLAALDLKLREAMQIELKRIQRDVGITFVFVTHDQHEALTLSDRIAVMSRGRVEQVDTPEAIYQRPSSVFVAGFIGSANLLPGSLRVEGGVASVVLDGGTRIEVPPGSVLDSGLDSGLGSGLDSGLAASGLAPGADATVMLRPERLRVLSAPAVPGRSLEATVGDVIFRGQDVRLIVHLADGTELVATDRRATAGAGDGLPPLAPGDPIVLGWAPDAPFVLPGRSAIVGATTTDLDEVQATLDGRLAGDTAPASEAPGGAERRFGRRALLVGGGLVGAAAVVGGVAALTGRGSVAVGPGSGERARAGAARDVRGTMGEGAERLRMFTWQSYIDPTEDGVVGTVDRFVAATGIEMTYDEGFNDNLEFFAREIEPYLGTGRPTNHDLVVPSYWMAARLEHLGWLEPLPVERIPNRVNLEARYLAQTWDYGAVYNLPWQGGITGIAYDPALTGRELRSVMDLFDPAFRGRVGMLKEMHDSVGMTMLGLGLDPSRVDEDGAYRAIERLARATAEGQFRAFTGNEYMRSLESGDFVACLAWSIDVQQVQTNRPEIRFVIPEEGALGWYDTMVIPKGAANGHAAAAWMDFVYDPVQAAQISLWVQGLSPVRGVRDELLRLGEDGVALAESPLMFPSDEETARLHVFPHLPDDVDARIVDRFLKVVGG